MREVKNVMGERDRTGSPPAKKPYVKPHVKRVVLKPEEAVLGTCKTASVSGPNQARCSTPSNCSSIGS